jgi:hypothetical protein
MRCDVSARRLCQRSNTLISGTELPMLKRVSREEDDPRVRNTSIGTVKRPPIRSPVVEVEGPVILTLDLVNVTYNLYRIIVE